MSRVMVRTWIAAAIACVLLLATLALVSATSGHRRPPWPRGTLLRLEARATRHPMDRILVTAVERDGPAILVEAGEHRTDGAVTAIDPIARTLSYHRFPTGELIGVEQERVTGRPIVSAAGALFDFDGDGSDDRVEIGVRSEHGVVRVRSGADDRVLFEHRDPLEYECPDRAFELPDLDGDGCAELALVHPRADRSRYDLELWDRFLGAKSWITIVSGREATR